MPIASGRQQSPAKRRLRPNPNSFRELLVTRFDGIEVRESRYRQRKAKNRKPTKPAGRTSRFQCWKELQFDNACIPSTTRPKGGVLLRVIRHAHNDWIVAALPLVIGLSSGVARAEDNATSTQPDDSATSKTKTITRTYELPPPESRWKTVGLGLGFAGVWYAGAWGLREWAWSESPGALDLRYPIVGPWIDLYKTGCPSNDTNCGKFGLVLRTIAVVIDGLGQAGGLAVALDGLFTPTASHSAAAQTSSRFSAAPRISFVPVPWSTPGGGGLSFVGQF